MSETTATPIDPARAGDDGYVFEFSGGNTALDFANTISRRTVPENSNERLTHYGRLVSWGVQAGLLAAKDAARLRAEAADHPRPAARALRRAITLREAIFALFRALSCGDRAPAGALDELNAALPRALAALRVGPDKDGFGWRFAHDDGDPAPMLAGVARSAAELLTSDELPRVRACGSDTCDWLFIDHSKNGSRRWCDMKSCGNRAKARRHYERERKAARSRRNG